MSWLLRLVPPRRHQHVEEHHDINRLGVSEAEAVALVRRVFGAGVTEVTEQQEKSWPRSAA